jgi:hypothetical protein
MEEQLKIDFDKVIKHLKPSYPFLSKSNANSDPPDLTILPLIKT